MKEEHSHYEEELQSMKYTYESKIQDYEKRIKFVSQDTETKIS